MNFKISFCTHKAAEYACKNWHYSKKIPKSKCYKLGVWEDGLFKGCIIFGSGATPNLGKPYGLEQTEICELTRIALTQHLTPVSKILSICIKILKKNTNLKLIVSFADTNEGHHGGIYQASNWIYTGKSDDAFFFIVNGEIIHPRAMQFMKKRGVKPQGKIIKKGKLRYLYPLDKKTYNKVVTLKKKYPKKCVCGVIGCTSCLQQEREGSNPIQTLKKKGVKND